MQLIFGIVLTIIGLMYCMESMIPLHKQAYRRVGSDGAAAYFLFQGKLFFGTALCIIVAEIARLAEVLTDLQNRWIVILILVVCVLLYMYNNYKRTGWIFICLGAERSNHMENSQKNTKSAHNRSIKNVNRIKRVKNYSNL